MIANRNVLQEVKRLVKLADESLDYRPEFRQQIATVNAICIEREEAFNERDEKFRQLNLEADAELREERARAREYAEQNGG